MADQGIERVVLPRHLTVAEMSAIVAEVNQVSFDAFLMVGKCPNTEGLCTFHHSSPEKIWPCEIPYELKPLNGSGNKFLTAALKSQKSWSTTNRRHGCGLCAIPHLLNAGIHGLKLVGRGAPAVQKCRNINLTRDFIRLATETESFSLYRKKAMAAHRERFGSACHQNVCYYPEFFYMENGYGGIE